MHLHLDHVCGEFSSGSMHGNHIHGIAPLSEFQTNAETRLTNFRESYTDAFVLRRKEYESLSNRRGQNLYHLQLKIC